VRPEFLAGRRRLTAAGLVAFQVRAISGFTVTVFATVGFGDITATASVARLLVTGQMIIDLIILGLGARVILGAVSRGRQRREPGAVPPGG